ncbi:MAG: hemolysin family protein [Anaerolineales bacterium]|jgi:putative hemolysin
MPNAVIEIVVIFLLILVNGLLAMAEIAIVSSRKVRLQQRAEEGDERSGSALELAREPDDFLSTVQVGITLVGVLTGAFGGATVADKLAVGIQDIPALAPYSHAIALVTVVLVITYFSLVLGELVPKRLALYNPERIAAMVAGPMRALSKVALPLVRLLSASTRVILRLLGVKPSQEPPITEEEVKVMLDVGTQAGVFEEVEQELVARVFRLGDRTVDSLMTPRTEIIWLDLEDPSEVNRRKITESPYSRLPVAVGDLDHMQGIIQAKSLLARCMAGEDFNLRAALAPPQYVPESMPAFRMLEFFRTSRVHIALVIDEFGGLQGLVTLSDILEAIVGDMLLKGKADEFEIVQREDGSWLLDGLLPVDEFMDLLNISHLPDGEQSNYQTVGGFVMSYLGRIPKAGDSFDWNDLHLEVMDMDGFRVDKVLVSPLPDTQ